MLLQMCMYVRMFFERYIIHMVTSKNDIQKFKIDIYCETSSKIWARMFNFQPLSKWLQTCESNPLKVAQISLFDWLSRLLDMDTTWRYNICIFWIRKNLIFGKKINGQPCYHPNFCVVTLAKSCYVYFSTFNKYIAIYKLQGSTC